MPNNFKFPHGLPRGNFINNPFAGNYNNLPEAALDLHSAFLFAQSVGESIEAFEQIVASSFYFKGSELAEYCWKIMHNLLMLPADNYNPEQVFRFGKAALNCHVRKIPCFPSDIPIPNNNNARTTHGLSFHIAWVYHFLGTACYDLMRYEQSLNFLGWADDALEDDDTSRCANNCVQYLSHYTQLRMYNVKVAMRKNNEAVVHMRKALTYKELVMNEGSNELRMAYVETYEAYVAAMDAERALPLCLKSLEICISLNGEESREVAFLRVDIGVLYHVQGQNDMANDQNRSWQNILENNSHDFRVACIKAATRLIDFGRYEKAIEVLTIVTSCANMEKGLISAFGNRASAYCTLGNFDDARECVRAVIRILEENDFEPIFAGNVFANMSNLYESMWDFVNAITSSRGALEIAEQHLKMFPEVLKYRKLFADSTSRLFSLFSPGLEKEILLLKIVLTKKLEEIYGREHIEVGYVCARLGVALMNTGHEDFSLTLIENAKYIMDASLGPHHLDSLRTSHTLSEFYATRGRFREAVDVKEQVNKGSEGLGPRDREYVRKLVEY